MKKSITYRWFAYGFSMIAAVLIVVGIAAVVLLRGFYYQQVTDVLEERATLYRRSAVLSVTSAAEWERTALSYVENFADKEQVELQVLSAKGSILASSTGFVPVGKDAGADFIAAQAAGGAAHHTGRNAAGEHIMALTVLEKDEKGTQIGALRYVVSLRLLDRQLLLLTIGVGAVVLLVLFFTAVAGLYFIRSIVQPVKEVGRAARRIAKGEYAYRVEKRSHDELGELCDTINYMAGEIERSERLKNEFISSVSHELRTPLTAIRGWTETLRTEGDTDVALREKGLEIISRETDRLSAMVEELLDFSRMQNGKLQLQFETVDVVAVLEDTVLLFRERAEKKGIAVHWVGTDSLPLIHADADRLRQVFINILDNAVKYTDAGDTVRVDYAALPDAVQVVIGDTGRGISEQDLAQVKQKFYKADMSRPGSGIGLAVADEIVNGHGGSLELHSKLGAGTSVIVTLPLGRR